MRRALLPLMFAVACTGAEEPVVCEAVGGSLSPASVGIVIDAEAGPDLDRVRADLESYANTMWSVSLGGAEAEHVVRLSIGGEGITVRTNESGTTIQGDDRGTLAYAAYVWLEANGVKFFHPLETYVPSYGRVALTPIDIQQKPMTEVRGLQLHLLHPIEWYDSFNGTDFESAKVLIDWLAATGQNHLQWPIMKTMDIATWKPHAAAVIDYAQERHVSVGVGLSLFGDSSLQNNYTLAEDESDWQNQLESRLDDILELPWGHIELAMGEFLTSDPEYLVMLLDHTTNYVKSASPTTTVGVTNHVGAYDNLYVEFRGNQEYFYFLPQYADRRLINAVHTVFFFDLFREWGMYGHADYFDHREFLYAQLDERPVRYKPESAYWVTADVDVPVFLPEYINARWLDIHRLNEDIEARNLPALEGHILFSSGHEWGYWLTDYLTAKALWQPELERRALIDHYAASYGTCQSRVAEALDGYIDLQSEYLFDQRLVSYLSGEDIHDDLGAVAGFTTHPPRVPFEEAAAFDRESADRFRAEVLAPLEAMVTKSDAIETTIHETCAGTTPAMQPWCNELLDGVAITTLRLRHSKALYEAVLSRRRADGRVALAEAESIRALARTVIDRRAAGYRFPVESLTGEKDNATIYQFGYLRQAHQMCYWTRQAQQAEHLVVAGGPALVTDLPTCLD